MVINIWVSIPSKGSLLRYFASIFFIGSHLGHCGVVHPPGRGYRAHFVMERGMLAALPQICPCEPPLINWVCIGGYFWRGTAPEDIHGVISGLSASAPLGPTGRTPLKSVWVNQKYTLPVAFVDPHLPPLSFLSVACIWGSGNNRA